MVWSCFMLLCGANCLLYCSSPPPLCCHALSWRVRAQVMEAQMLAEMERKKQEQEEEEKRKKVSHGVDL